MGLSTFNRATQLWGAGKLIGHPLTNVSIANLKSQKDNLKDESKAFRSTDFLKESQIGL